MLITPQEYESHGADPVALVGAATVAGGASTPDACLEDMQQIGFHLDPDREDIGPTTNGAFALAERLTGVRVTAKMLKRTVFLGSTLRWTAPTAAS